jgi:hypothetical protein
MILAYALLAGVVRHACTKTDNITFVSMVIFAMHQNQAFMKIDPFADVSRQPVFRAESLLCLYTFIVTIGTFLPIKYYLPPTLMIYAGTHWLTYHFDEKRDLCAYESFITVFLNVTMGIVCAYTIHLAVDEGFKFEGERNLIDVMKD